MKKRLLGFLLGVMFVSVCVGCGAESATTKPTETVTETTTEENTPEQTEAPTAIPEKTVEPTPEANIEAVEEATTEPETTEPTKTAEPEQAEIPTTEPVPQYTYTDMSATMFAQQTVNVRDLPDTNGNKVGSLSTNDEITISGQCNETGWYRFDYNGNVAYVSNKYVGDKKVEVAAPANNNSGSGSEASGSTSSNTCPYPLWQPVDNWDKISWYVTQPDPNWETSGHKETQAWMQQTILDRFGDEKWQPGYTVYAQQVTWQYIGTYAEGNVYLQEFAIGLFPN